MIKFYFLVFLLLAGTCQSVEKEDWIDKLHKKDKVRFQIPVFEIENASREKRIQISQEFADSWSKNSGFDAIVLDEQIKSDLLRANRQIPSSNFAIQSKFSDEFLRLLVVDLETGEILSYGKMKLVSEENLSDQFEKVIEEQLLVPN